MTDSPDDTQRVPSWDGRHRVDPGLEPAGRPQPTLRWSRSPATLGSAAVGLIVVVVVGALTVLANPHRSELPPPAAGEAIELGTPDIPAVEPPPTISFSPAPVSLSTRASRAPSPTRPASRSPSARPKPSPSSPKPQPTQPRPGELTPLPPSHESNLRSAGGGPETFVDFVNARSEPVIVYWLDYGGQRQQYAILQPGRWYRQQTYVGHPWVVTDARGIGLVCFQPADETLRAVVR